MSTPQVGLTGDIYLNENGDREADYTLNDLDSETGVMVPVATYYGVKQLYEKHSNVLVAWPGGRDTAPPDVPFCGFTGDAVECREPEGFPVAFTVSAVTFLLCLVVITVGGIVFRKLRLESALSDMWWMVKWDDIAFVDNRKGDPGKRSQASIGLSEGSLLAPKSAMGSLAHSARSGSQASSMNTTCANVHGVKIGTYKGIRVAVKLLEVQKFHVNRKLLTELKLVRIKVFSLKHVLKVVC